MPLIRGARTWNGKPDPDIFCRGHAQIKIEALNSKLQIPSLKLAIFNHRSISLLSVAYQQSGASVLLSNLKLHQRKHLYPLTDLRGTVQEAEFADEIHVDGFHGEVADEFDGCFGRAAGGEQVVVEQHHVTRFQGVLMDVEDVFAIFQTIGFGKGGRGQFAGFANGHEACVEACCQGTAQDEAARFDANHFGDAHVLVIGGGLVEHIAKNLGTFDGGGDVFKLYAGDGEIGHVADGFYHVEQCDGCIGI